MKKLEKISFDAPALAILPFSKAKLIAMAKAMKSNLDPLTEKEALYKLNFLIDTRLEYIKEEAKENFVDKFGGSQTEKENGFIISLKSVNEYKYSEYVQRLEADLESLKSTIKNQKDAERENAEVVKTNEVLAFTLK